MYDETYFFLQKKVLDIEVHMHQPPIDEFLLALFLKASKSEQLTDIEHS